jgi:hypothetical protein
MSTCRRFSSTGWSRAAGSGDLIVVEQQPVLQIKAERALPLCQWPAWPHYKAGDAKSAARFVCVQ